MLVILGQRDSDFEGFCSEPLFWLGRISPVARLEPVSVIQSRDSVVQSIVSLTSWLRGQLFKCFMTL